MNLAELRALVASHVPDDQPDGAAVVLPMSGMFIVRHLNPSRFTTLAIGPFASLILQGRKEVRLDHTTVVYNEGQTTVLGHDIPVEYCIAKGSPEEPFYALLFQLDFDVLRQLKGRIDALTDGAEFASALHRVEQDTDLIAALGRYLSLADNDVEREILAPAILEEMHLRLLQSESATILRDLLSQDSHASRIAQSIAIIRNNLREPLGVEEIATKVGMGKSTFYTHFQQFTGKTPNAFAKNLRLCEARRLNVEQKKPISAVAFEIGYASTAQFSRDYKQHFGMTPSEDRK